MNSNISVVVAIGGVAILIVAVVTGSGLFSNQSTADLTQVCEERFSDGYTADGWMLNNPPLIKCSGPDGDNAVTPMPYDVAKERGLNATAYSEEWGE